MKTPKLRGFASLSPEEQKRIARMGGRAVQRSGKAHHWTSEEAAEAGRKGGEGKQRRTKQFIGFVEEI